MYINPFVAGILVTLFVEAIALVGFGIYSNIKDKKQEVSYEKRKITYKKTERVCSGKQNVTEKLGVDKRN